MNEECFDRDDDDRDGVMEARDRVDFELGWEMSVDEVLRDWVVHA